MRLSGAVASRRGYPTGRLANLNGLVVLAGLAARCHTAGTVDVERTKIVATLGPASSEREVLGAMVDAGLDVVRLNFSHGERADHLARFGAREWSREEYLAALRGALRQPTRAWKWEWDGERT